MGTILGLLAQSSNPRFMQEYPNPRFVHNIIIINNFTSTLLPGETGFIHFSGHLTTIHCARGFSACVSVAEQL